MAAWALGWLWPALALAVFYSQGWQTLRVAQAVIQYRTVDERVALQIGRWYRQAQPRFEKFYGPIQIKPFRIVVSSPLAFRKMMAQAGLPEWVQAVFLSQERTILVKSPREEGNMDQLAQDFVHELAHLYTLDCYGNTSVPVWYNEGFSEYLSQGQISIHQAIVLANALWSKRLIPLMAMEDLMHFNHNEAQLAYLEALSAVRYLEQLFPPDFSWPKFHALVATKGWKQTLQQATGLDEVDFQVKWYQHIRNRYRWMILLNLENFLWFGLLFVFVVIFLLIRRRNRKRLRLWELEEQVFPDEWEL